MRHLLGGGGGKRPNRVRGIMGSGGKGLLPLF